MAENLGLINELGHQVLLASLDAVQRWNKAGLELSMAINVSNRQLFTPYFTERLKEEVAKYSIVPHRIILEITESIAMLDVEHAADRLHEIRQAGFQIALDDFGTGYSSLSQLHEMHVDELKIDISFVRRLNEPNGLSMTQAIINLAHALKMETVAELWKPQKPGSCANWVWIICRDSILPSPCLLQNLRNGWPCKIVKRNKICPIFPGGICSVSRDCSSFLQARQPF
jgi:predicted signal transduction protein with EAL and GGDEF domain